MIKRVIIAGSRNFTDYEFFSSAIDEFLLSMKDEFELIILSGHCAGTDTMAERYAKEKQIQTEIHIAQWDKYGRGAGPKRNKEMVDRADYVIAFSSGGKGTKSLIEHALQKGVPTKIYLINDTKNLPHN